MRAQGAVSHRHDVVAAHEHVRLAKSDPPLWVGVAELGGAQHDEQRVLILLQLRPLMGPMSVLDRQVV